MRSPRTLILIGVTVAGLPAAARARRRPAEPAVRRPAARTSPAMEALAPQALPAATPGLELRAPAERRYDRQAAAARRRWRCRREQGWGADHRLRDEHVAAERARQHRCLRYLARIHPGVAERVRRQSPVPADLRLPLVRRRGHDVASGQIIGGRITGAAEPVSRLGDFRRTQGLNKGWATRAAATSRS